MNPAAGRRSPAHVEEAVRASFARRGVDATIDAFATRAPEDATARTRDAKERYDIVVAVGGDGTVRDVAAGLAGSATPLAIIRNGTANVLASDLGIPVRTRDAADLLRDGARTVPLDLGVVNGRPFVLNVGAGYAARLILGTPHSWKKRVGFFAYLPAAVRATFQHDRAQTTIELDGARWYEGRVQMIFVANSGGIGGRAIQIAEDVRYDDGLFTVAVFTPRSPIATLIAFAQIAARRWSRITGVQYGEGTRIAVHCDPPLPMQVDGDGMGTTPFAISMQPAAIRVIVPDGTA
jgi:diacylglycerol kinase (ATP)